MVDDDEIDFSNVPHKSIQAPLKSSTNFGSNDKLSPKKFTSGMNVVAQAIETSVEPKKLQLKLLDIPHQPKKSFMKTPISPSKDEAKEQ